MDEGRQADTGWTPFVEGVGWKTGVGAAVGATRAGVEPGAGMWPGAGAGRGGAGRGSAGRGAGTGWRQNWSHELVQKAFVGAPSTPRPVTVLPIWRSATAR